MSSVKELTGGTGDVNPQYLTAQVAQTGADVTTAVTFPLPVPRFSPKTGRSIVLEVLRVSFDLRTANWTFVNNARVTATISSSNTAFDVDDHQTFASWSQAFQQTISADCCYIWNSPHFTDCTDGAGHGLLIATNAITLAVSSVLTNDTNIVDYKIWYRYKEVGLQEYIGIVGQQN